MTKHGLYVNDFGMWTVAWMEDGHRKKQSFDTYRAAVAFYNSLKKKGLL